MLSRLGLVIHWLFILVALFLIAMALQYYLWLETLWMPRQPFGELIFQYNLRDGIFYSPIGLIFAPIGWAFNFILTGHKSPLPWVANKETSND
jgi:hypothetical protein